MSARDEFDWDTWGSKVRASLGPRQPPPQKKGGIKKRPTAEQPRPSGSAGRDTASPEEYHFKKDGSLDMRFASSKAARDRGECDERGFLYSGGPTPTSTSSSHEYHFKKDGSLDMRFASSKAARDRGECDERGFLYSGGPKPTPTSSNEYHFKKDGSLDMRFASSKAARDSGECDEGGFLYSGGPKPTPTSSSEYHFKKDGSLDMRFASSKAARDRGECDERGFLYSRGCAVPKCEPVSKYHYMQEEDLGHDSDIREAYHVKADGSLDMRFASSKAARDRGECDEQGRLYSKMSGSGSKPSGPPKRPWKSLGINPETEGQSWKKTDVGPRRVPGNGAKGSGQFRGPSVILSDDDDSDESSDVEYLG